MNDVIMATIVRERSFCVIPGKADMFVTAVETLPKGNFNIKEFVNPI